MKERPKVPFQTAIQQSAESYGSDIQMGSGKQDEPKSGADIQQEPLGSRSRDYDLRRSTPAPAIHR